VRVGLLHPGEMGAAIGALLVERGHEVLWLPRGRSEETARRAAAAGLTSAEDLNDAGVILSVVPPHAALDVARSVQGAPALVIDANAVSPMTATRIGELLGGRWVDGGIVGPPPTQAGTTRLYLSGERAIEAAGLFEDTNLEPVVLHSSPVAASALKMAYAAWTKGSAALLLSSLASARATGVEDALLVEWSRSQPKLEARSRAASHSAAAKGWRWVGEMNEIAATYAAVGLPSGFHDAAAAMFERAAGQERADLNGRRPITFNHVAVAAKDKRQSATFLKDILGLPEPTSWGPFLSLTLDDGVRLDYAEPGIDFPGQHYALLVSDEVFDCALERLKTDGVPFSAGPGQPANEINHNHGGRGVYFDDPSGHHFELMTQPYGADL